MKKKMLSAIVLLLLLFPLQISHAKQFVHYRTYEIVKVTENSITMRDKEGKEHILNWEPKGLKVGDKVRYDRLRHKLDRTPLPKDAE